MIHKLLKQKLLTIFKEENIKIIQDLWKKEDIMIYIPLLRWISPATIDISGWQPIKQFEGTASILLPVEKEPPDITPLIARLVYPLQNELDFTTKEQNFGYMFYWQFENQKDNLTELTYTIQLEGPIKGTLLKRTT